MDCFTFENKSYLIKWNAWTNCYSIFRIHLFEKLKRGSCMVWKINMGVCPHLDFENIILFNCLGYNFNIYGAFEFVCNSVAYL